MLHESPMNNVEPRYAELAEKSLAGQLLSPAEMKSVIDGADERLPELLEAAFRVRYHYYGKKVQIHVLMNAKSGLCPEDCGYCSQSSVSDARDRQVPVHRQGRRWSTPPSRPRKRAPCVFCLVNSGRGPTLKETEKMAEAVAEIKSRVPINICACMGLLTESKARILKDAGVERINHNLNTSSRYHPEVVSTHSYDDRVATLESVKAAGLSTCCGGIIGLGEQSEDVMDLAVSLRELDVDSIPVNFLHAIPGTPMEGRSNLTPQYCLKVLCLFRFVNPSKEIRVAGGREVNLRSLQPLSLYPANSIFRQRLPDHVRSGRHRCPSNDRGPGLRDRDGGAGSAAGTAEYRVDPYWTRADRIERCWPNATPVGAGFKPARAHTE